MHEFAGRAAVFTIALSTIVLSRATSAQVTQAVAPDVGTGPTITSDGRFLAFESNLPLVPDDTNGVTDIYVRDMRTGALERVSVAFDGREGFYPSRLPSISADGRYVAFASEASNLVHGDTGGHEDVFVRDRELATTERVSVASFGIEADADSAWPKISSDGRYVVFSSSARNLVPNDTNFSEDVFRHDRRTGATERISLSSMWHEGNGASYLPTLSADGRFAAFVSDASNLVPGDTNGASDVFVRNLESGRTERIPVPGYAQPHWDVVFDRPSLSADGRFVAFDWSECDACGRDIYVFDRETLALELIDGNPAGNPYGGESFNPSISADGRFVSFDSDDPTLVPGDTNEATDIFVRDRLTSTTERISVGPEGAQGNLWSGFGGFGLCHDCISADGRFVSYASAASNLVPGVSGYNGYLCDRAHPEPPSLCEPGVAGVLACPCANAPASRNRGCDNSSATGGARLSIGGGEYISSDTLFFGVTGAKPSAASIVLQSMRPRSNGTTFGQGVRCVGGDVVALYVRKTSIDGSLLVPDFDRGDLPVHVQAESVGDPIPPMHTRWYQVLYRDPIVLGGCPAAATFNATQAREVLWLP